MSLKLGSAPERENGRYIDRRPEDFGVLNAQYPASYWCVALSEDVRQGEAVPIRRFEKDLVLWRDASGKVQCQDHCCRQRFGRLDDSWALERDIVVCRVHRESFASCQKYVAAERYGAIFVWSGAHPADHDFPDLLAEKGIREEDICWARWRAIVPFPTKYLAENLPDAGHFAYIHHNGDWGRCEVIRDEDVVFEVRQVLGGRRRYLTPTELINLYRRDDLFDFLEVSGEIVAETHGGGMNYLRFLPPARPQSNGLRLTGAMGRLVEQTPVLPHITPVDATSHIVIVLMAVPKVRLPLVGETISRLVGEAAFARNWVGLRQDFAVMAHRLEPEGPVYNRLDRPLIRFRRYWDRRLVDRALSAAGDNIHANGRRAGIGTSKSWVSTSESTSGESLVES